MYGRSSEQSLKQRRLYDLYSDDDVNETVTEFFSQNHHRAAGLLLLFIIYATTSSLFNRQTAAGKVGWNNEW